jgi:hypothetical protein
VTASTPDGRPLRDYPQAIADDYPGWTITSQHGIWAASCPALTVHADTPDGLRAAIEQAINPGHDDDPAHG